jgi:hypothetical protein
MYVIATVQAAWLWWAYSQGWFLQADLSNLADAVGKAPTWDYLTSPLGGHFSPIPRLVYWLLNELAPLDYGLSVLIRVAAQFAATVLLYRLLVSLIRDRVLVSIVVTLYAMNPLLLAGTAMFTPGLGIQFAQVFVVGGYVMFDRYMRNGGLRPALGAGALIALGAMCSEQSLILFLVLPLLALVHYYTGPFGSRLKQFGAHWRAWLVIVIPVFAAGVAALVFADPTGAASPSLSASYKLIRNSWLYAIAPSWIGGPLTWYAGPQTYIGFAAARDTMVVAGQVAVAVTVLLGVQRRGRVSLAAWTLPLTCWVISMLLVGYRGFTQVGVLAAITPRNLAALIVVFAIGAALALAPRDEPPTEAQGEPEPQPRPATASRGASNSVWATTAVLAVVLALCVVSGVRFARIYSRNPAQGYMNALTISAHFAGAKPNVFDTPVPADIISPVEPNHRVTDMLRLAGVDVLVNDPSSTPLVATPAGVLRPSVFVAAASVKPVGSCGSAVHGTDTYTFPLTRLVSPASWYLHLQLFQSKPSTVTVVVLDQFGKPHDPAAGSQLSLAPLESVFLRLPFMSPTAIRITGHSADTALCLPGISVGGPFPVSK